MTKLKARHQGMTVHIGLPGIKTFKIPIQKGQEIIVFEVESEKLAKKLVKSGECHYVNPPIVVKKGEKNGKK